MNTGEIEGLINEVVNELYWEIILPNHKSKDEILEIIRLKLDEK